MAWPNYPGALSYPARAGKASSRNGTKIDRIIIHVMVGSFEGSMRWASDSPNNSFHYGVALDARIGQAVDEKWAAWHAGNWPVNKRSIGIEHEDQQRWSSPNWWTEKQIRASAKLAAHLCRKYGIPADREHILPHWQVASDGRACPGPHFPLAWYISLVQEYLGGSAPAKPGTKTIYRVQLGAFSKREGAEALEGRVKAAGFDAFVTRDGGYWKVQSGAFGVRANADRRARELQAAGFGTFISGGKADGGGNPPDRGTDMRTSYPRERITAHINFDAWMPAAERAAREVSDKFQPRSLNSYPGHGGEPRDALEKGNSTSVDYFVAEWTTKPTPAQARKRIEMAKYVIKNRRRMPVKYAISGGYIWTRRFPWWRKYNPSGYNLWHPLDNYWSKGHYEHLHVTYLWD